MAISLFEHNEITYKSAVKMLTERKKAAVIHHKSFKCSLLSALKSEKDLLAVGSPE